MNALDIDYDKHRLVNETTRSIETLILIIIGYKTKTIAILIRIVVLAGVLSQIILSNDDIACVCVCDALSKEE